MLCSIIHELFRHRPNNVLSFFALFMRRITNINTVLMLEERLRYLIRYHEASVHEEANNKTALCRFVLASLEQTHTDQYTSNHESEQSAETKYVYAYVRRPLRWTHDLSRPTVHMDWGQ